MKKTTSTISTLSIIMFTALILSGCQFFEDKWNKRNADLPDSYYQTQQQLLNTAQEALKQDANNFTAQFEVGYRYHMIGQYKNAVTEYEKALVMTPGDFATLNNLAAVYEEVKEYSTAAKYIKQLYESNSGNAEVISDTVRILLENGEPTTAKSALENYAKVIREKGDVSEGDMLMISELYQSIDNYNKPHEKK